MKNFNNIFYTGNLGDTPASVNLATGDLYLNSVLWPKLKKEHRVFIQLHELGHYLLQTRDEIEADNFAFEAYAKLGYPLSESIYALSENLTGENPEHFLRVESAGARARAFDKKAMVAFEGETNVLDLQAEAFNQCDAMLGLHDGDFDDEVKAVESSLRMMAGFDECKDIKRRTTKNRCYKKRTAAIKKLRGALVKAINNRNSKRAMRNERRKSKVYANCMKKVGTALRRAGTGARRTGKGEQRSARGEADRLLAEQGIDSQKNRREATMNGIGGIVDSIAGIFGGGSQGEAAQNNQMIIIIVIAVAVIGGYFFTKKSKKNGNTSKA